MEASAGADQNNNKRTPPHDVTSVKKPGVSGMQNDAMISGEPTDPRSTSNNTMLKPNNAPDPYANESYLSDEDQRFNIRKEEEGSAEGTIVSNKRVKKWSFSEEVGKSLTGWFGKKKEDLAEMTKEIKKPKEEVGDKVAPAILRKETIQKAAKRSRLAPQDDHEEVLAKLRTFERDAVRATGKPFTLKKDALEDDTPRWKFTNEEEERRAAEKKKALAKEQAAAQRVRSKQAGEGAYIRGDIVHKDSFKAIAPESPHTTPESAFVEEGTRPAEEPRPLKKKARPIQAETETYTRGDVVHKDPFKAIAPEALRTTPLSEFVEEDTQPKTPSGYASYTPEDKKEKWEAPPRERSRVNVRTFRDDAIQNVEEERLSIPRIAAAEAVRREQTERRESVAPTSRFFGPRIVIALGLVVVIGGIGVGTYNYLAWRRAPPPAAVGISAYTRTVAQTPITLPSDREVLLGTLARETSSVSGKSGDIVQFYPVKEGVDGKAVQATTVEIMDILNIRAPGSFVRSLRPRMMFGTYVSTSGNQPFIIMKAEQFDTTFAGMLAWEEFMSADLAPLFGEPIRRTFDPTARTEDQATDAHFTDTTIENHDVRVLYDESRRERILHTFIDQDTILITTTTETLLGITEALR